MLGGLIWNDTVRCLRAYHDRFIAANPRAVTYFYEPWLGVSDLNDPRRWIAYERAAAPIWRGIVTRVNLSLEAEGRSDRIVPLPAASALAALVERATSPEGVQGLSCGSTRETLSRLFTDDVHLTALGSYYLALVTYGCIAKGPVAGAWVPDGVAADAAASLKALAGHCADSESVMANSWPLDVVRRYVLEQFNSQYWTYMRDVYYRQDRNRLSAWLKAARHRFEWQRLFSLPDSRNPLSDVGLSTLSRHGTVAAPSGTGSSGPATGSSGEGNPDRS